MGLKNSPAGRTKSSAIMCISGVDGFERRLSEVAPIAISLRKLIKTISPELLRGMITLWIC
jgi:hypothetical protein